jgi:predicted Zn-dependent protease
MDPASGMVRVGRALWFLLPTLQLAEALEEIRRAVALDPFSPAVRTTELWILYTMRKSDAADRARGLIQMFPSLPICRFAAGLTLLRDGATEEAVFCVEEGLKIVPGDVFLLGVLALARARQGQARDAEQIRAGLEARSETRYIPFLSRAYAAEACGDMDIAYQLLGQAVEEREPLAVIALADRRADVSPHPTYTSLLYKMNLE